MTEVDVLSEVGENVCLDVRKIIYDYGFPSWSLESLIKFREEQIGLTCEEVGVIATHKLTDFFFFPRTYDYKPAPLGVGDDCDSTYSCVVCDEPGRQECTACRECIWNNQYRRIVSRYMNLEHVDCSDETRRIADKMLSILTWEKLGSTYPTCSREDGRDEEEQDPYDHEE